MLYHSQLLAWQREREVEDREWRAKQDELDRRWRSEHLQHLQSQKYKQWAIAISTLLVTCAGLAVITLLGK